MEVIGKETEDFGQDTNIDCLTETVTGPVFLFVTTVTLNLKILALSAML